MRFCSSKSASLLLVFASAAVLFGGSLAFRSADESFSAPSTSLNVSRQFPVVQENAEMKLSEFEREDEFYNTRAIDNKGKEIAGDYVKAGLLVPKERIAKAVRRGHGLNGYRLCMKLKNPTHFYWVQSVEDDRHEILDAFRKAEIKTFKELGNLIGNVIEPVFEAQDGSNDLVKQVHATVRQAHKDCGMKIIERLNQQRGYSHTSYVEALGEDARKHFVCAREKIPEEEIVRAEKHAYLVSGLARIEGLRLATTPHSPTDIKLAKREILEQYKRGGSKAPREELEKALECAHDPKPHSAGRGVSLEGLFF